MTLTINPESILCIIPFKSLDKAKTRLRKSFSQIDQSKVDEIVLKLFLNTISTVKQNFKFSVVSPSEDILELALQHENSAFVYQDSGMDLNEALASTINYAVHLKKWEAIFILMADLPFLNTSSLTRLKENFRTNEIMIISAPEKVSEHNKGTSGLLFPTCIWPKIALQFGNNSFERFKKMFILKKYSFSEYNEKLGYDLDNYSDLKFIFDFKDQYELINEIYDNFNSIIA